MTDVPVGMTVPALGWRPPGTVSLRVFRKLQATGFRSRGRQTLPTEASTPQERKLGQLSREENKFPALPFLNPRAQISPEAPWLGPVKAYISACTHVQTWPHGPQHRKETSGWFSMSSQCVTSIYKVSTQWGKIEKIRDMNPGPRRVAGTAGVCEGESSFTLAHEPSIGPYKM